MIEAIGEHRVAAPRERGEDREIGEIAGRKRERAHALARTDERRELGFERVVRRRSGRRRGATRPRPTPQRARRVARGRDDRRMAARARGNRCSRTRRPRGPRRSPARPAATRRAPRAHESGAARAASSRSSFAISVDRTCHTVVRMQRSPDRASRRRRRDRGRFRLIAATEALRPLTARRDRRGTRAAQGPHPDSVCRASPSFANSAWSASASGLPVVSRLIAVEHRVRAGEETQRLHGFAQLPPPGREPHHRLRHRDARHRDRAHEFERVERRRAGKAVVQRRALDLHQMIDRHRFRVRIEVGELRDRGPRARAATRPCRRCRRSTP